MISSLQESARVVPPASGGRLRRTDRRGFARPRALQVAALRGPLTDPEEDEQRGRAVQLIAQVGRCCGRFRGALHAPIEERVARACTEACAAAAPSLRGPRSQAWWT